MTEPTSYRDYIRRQAERFRESQRQVEEFIHRHALLTPHQDAPVWPLETLSGVIAGMQSPEGVTGVQESTQRLARMTADTATDDGLDALYAELAGLRAEVEHWRSGGGDGYGTPVHWTVYNAMHHRALAAEEERDRARRIAVELENELARAAAQLATAQEQARVATVAALNLQRQTSDRSQCTLDRIRRATTWGAVWVELGQYYGLTAEQAGAEARTRRLVNGEAP